MIINGNNNSPGTGAARAGFRTAAERRPAARPARARGQPERRVRARPKLFAGREAGGVSVLVYAITSYHTLL